MSTGYMNTMARMNGYELVGHVQTADIRAAMMYKQTKKPASPYLPTCFPIPPAVANPTES
jgi:hypothetical protein